jgi:hypothetical protein
LIPPERGKKSSITQDFSLPLGEMLHRGRGGFNPKTYPHRKWGVEKVLFNRKVHKVHLLRQQADSVDKNAKSKLMDQFFAIFAQTFATFAVNGFQLSQQPRWGVEKGRCHEVVEGI